MRQLERTDKRSIEKEAHGCCDRERDWGQALGRVGRLIALIMLALPGACTTCQGDEGQAESSRQLSGKAARQRALTAPRSPIYRVYDT